MPDSLPEQLAGRPEIAGFFQGRPVLVTGGLGFVGSNLTRALVALGARVTVLDNLHEKYGGNRFNLEGVLDQVELVEFDQGDEKALGRLVGRFETIFNMVGQVNRVDSMENPHLDLYTNVTAHVSLLEACRKHSPKAIEIGDYGKIKRVLGREPKVVLEQGIAETVAYHQQNREQYSQQVHYP